MRLASRIGLALGAALLASTIAPGSGRAAGLEAAPAAPRLLLDPAVWGAWRDRFMLADGRVVDDGNGGISHSEGQGYGMLLAAFAGDRDGFDRLWTWTRTQLAVRDDGLFAWRYDPAAKPPITDRNNATDGDILIAWALVEGARRWSDAGLAQAAGGIARAVQRGTIAETEAGRMLLPGAAGFSASDRPDGPVVNLSYWVFPAFPALAEVAPEYDWTALTASGRDLALAARFGRRSLPADWTALGGDAPRPAAGFPPTFAWNAIRVPLYIAWAGTGERQHLAPFAALWPAGAASDPAVVHVDRDVDYGRFGEADYRAVPALVACALEGTKLPDSLKSRTMTRYYPSTLRLLVLAAAADRYPTCL